MQVTLGKCGIQFISHHDCVHPNITKHIKRNKHNFSEAKYAPHISSERTESSRSSILIYSLNGLYLSEGRVPLYSPL